MLRAPLFLLLVLLLPSSVWAADEPVDTPAYTADGQLKFPAEYRNWIFLTSGVDMSYNPKPTDAMHTMFNNVFVNPDAYKQFLATGTWPDRTQLVLENRAGESARSINTRGRTQSAELMGLEVHVKDTAGGEKAAPGGWSFYSFDNQISAKRIAQRENCYSCHEQHAAVDTTFVQFYPTLFVLAQSRKTLSASYLKESAEPPTHSLAEPSK